MAILATFTDLKPIKGRKVVQIVLEAPMEKADEVLAALGGYPQSDNPQWVGVAPIDPEASQKPQEKPKGGKLAQRAGILCGEGAFRKFMFMKFGKSSTGPDGIAVQLRSICGISSRADLDQDKEAADRFLSLEADYRDWMRS